MAVFLLRANPQPISIIVDESVLANVKGLDHEVLRKAFSGECDTSRCLKELSPAFKDALLAIGGPESASLLAVPPNSCSIPFLDLKHFSHGSIEFSLRHISQLPEWTKGKRGKTFGGDRIIVTKILGPPYLQGDHLAVNPKGAVDFALSALLHDSVWIDDDLCLVSPEYPWHKLYMAERGAATIYQACLGSTVRFGMGHDTRTYAESGTKYKATASAPFRALAEVGGQNQNATLALVGRNSTFLRAGMGVIAEPPIAELLQLGPVDFEQIYGSVTEIDTHSGYITIRLLLNREQLPEYVLTKLAGNELLQTNLTLKVPFHWVTGSFNLWPSLLYQAECIPQVLGMNSASRFHGRVVLCDLQIHLDGDGVSSIRQGDTMATLDVFEKLKSGQLAMTLSRLKPFTPATALSYLVCMNEMRGGLSPPAFAYATHLGHTLTAFARGKAEHARTAKEPLTFRPQMPGNAMMELLYRVVGPEQRNVSVRNGNMLVEVSNLDSLRNVFGCTPARFDLRSEGQGIIEFHGPFVFKWSMYDTTDPWGPLSGSVSISVGAFTEYSRMGTEVIKSSKCHPDALRGVGAKGPRETQNLRRSEASDSKATSATVAGKTRQQSKGPDQAIARMQRQAKRMALSQPVAVSAQESSDSGQALPAERSCSSRAPPCSESGSSSVGELDSPPAVDNSTVTQQASSEGSVSPL